MNLLVQSNILGDTRYTIVLLRVHASGGWCEILEIERKVKGPPGTTLAHPLGGNNNVQSVHSSREHKKEKGDPK